VAWRRSARARRVSLRIDPSRGTVVVTLPPRASAAVGLALLQSEAAWVAERLARLPQAVAFTDGARLPLDGVEHRIRHRPAGIGGAWLEAGEIVVGGEACFLARRLADFLRAEARRRLAPLAAELAMKAGVRVLRLTVKDTRSRWGSCTASGRLAFSWRLLMAPPFVQRYVVAHEVAHLRHLNHGPRFWALVAELTPDCEGAKAWLAAHGPRLLRVGGPPAGGGTKWTL
jgi:hypothetical protein